MSDPQVTYTVSDGYIALPVDVDADTLLADELDAIAAAVPGWVARESHLEVALLEAFSRMAAETAQVAAQVPIAIFTYFGQLVGVLPQAGAGATTTTTWTMVNNAGYTVPAGTVVGFAVTGSDLILFETVADFTVPPGSTATAAGAVTIQALEVGTIANGITAGALTLVDQLASVASIASTATTAGGVDAETQTAYLDRLSAELQTLSPRPILPADFATLAAQTAGVYRALAIDGLNQGRAVTDGATTNTSTVISSATATFTSTDVGRSVAGAGVPGATTIASLPSTTIAAPSSGATLPQGTINVAATTNFPAAGRALVTTTTGPQTVAYTGVTGTTLTGCTGGTGTLATGNAVTSMTAAVMSAAATATATGVTLTFGDLTGQQRTITIAGVDAAGAALSGPVKIQLTSDLQAKREVNFVVLVIDPTFTMIDVIWSAASTAGSNGATVQAAVTAAVTAFLSAATWGGGTAKPPKWNAGTSVVRYLDLAAVIKAVPGVDHITALTFGVHGGSMATTDVTLAGNAPLPLVGTLSGNVT